MSGIRGLPRGGWGRGCFALARARAELSRAPRRVPLLRERVFVHRARELMTDLEKHAGDVEHLRGLRGGSFGPGPVAAVQRVRFGEDAQREVLAVRAVLLRGNQTRVRFRPLQSLHQRAQHGDELVAFAGHLQALLHGEHAAVVRHFRVRALELLRALQEGLQRLHVRVRGKSHLARDAEPAGRTQPRRPRASMSPRSENGHAASSSSGGPRSRAFTVSRREKRRPRNAEPSLSTEARAHHYTRHEATPSRLRQTFPRVTTRCSRDLARLAPTPRRPRAFNTRRHRRSDSPFATHRHRRCSTPPRSARPPRAPR